MLVVCVMGKEKKGQVRWENGIFECIVCFYLDVFSNIEEKE